MTTKNLLVTGATGKQGGALIDALLSSPNPSFEIYALTRNASSAGSKSLSSKSPSIHIIEGNTLDLAPVVQKIGPLYGLFCITTVGKNEEEQGKKMIDVALANGVEHFVFSSVDRGGPTISDNNPTNIPHFLSKHNIELYLKEKTAATVGKMKWTILRPTAFYDNFTPDFGGKGFAVMWNQIGTKPLQLIGCRDIGFIAAKAFQNPAKYSGRSITLAGDELNFQQANGIFKKEMGQDIPLTFGFVGTAIKTIIGEMGKMFQWFKDDGYGCDIPALKKEFPEVQDFGTWLRESSKFKK